jgi:hypothetical protein
MDEAESEDFRPESGALALLAPASLLSDAPTGASGAAVRAWFDDAVETLEPVMDGSLAAEQEAATMFQRLAKADNTRIAYRAAVRAWCAWCDARSLTPPCPLPAPM